MANDFYYHLTHRPPSIGTHPDGGEVVQVNNQREETDGVFSWGVLRYDRALSLADMMRYELQPYCDVERAMFYAIKNADDAEEMFKEMTR